MNENSKVLVTTSVIVDVLDDEDGSSDRMKSISDKFRDAVAYAFKDDDSVQSVGSVAYDWFRDYTTNVGKCVDCNRWVSNRQEPNELCGLSSATIVDGQLICDECRCFGDRVG